MCRSQSRSLVALQSCLTAMAMSPEMCCGGRVGRGRRLGVRRAPLSGPTPRIRATDLLSESHSSLGRAGLHPREGTLPGEHRAAVCDTPQTTHLRQQNGLPHKPVIPLFLPSPDRLLCLYEASPVRRLVSLGLNIGSLKPVEAVLKDALGESGVPEEEGREHPGLGVCIGMGDKHMGQTASVCGGA